MVMADIARSSMSPGIGVAVLVTKLGSMLLLTSSPVGLLGISRDVGSRTQPGPLHPDSLLTAPAEPRAYRTQEPSRFL
jgi:hypothetical protein